MDTFVEALDDLAESLVAVGVEAATDPGAVQVPGALVQLAGLDYDVLAGYTVAARVVLIAPDVDWPQAAAVLAELLDQALTADLVNVTGRVEAATMPLPDNPATPLPVLLIPVLLSVLP